MLEFAKVGGFDLLLGKCPNNHLHIFGFPHQLEGKLDVKEMTLTTEANCRECGGVVRRVDKIQWSKHCYNDGAGI